MKTVVSKTLIINKLKELGYKANFKNTNTSLLEKGYVLIYDVNSENGFVKIPAAKLGFENYTSYQGYGYHGGGRKKKAPEDKKKFVTVSISGSPEEIAQLKEKAKQDGKTVSRFVLDNML